MTSSAHHLVNRFRQLRAELWPQAWERFNGLQLTQNAEFLLTMYPLNFIDEVMQRNLRWRAAQGFTAPYDMLVIRNALQNEAARNKTGRSKQKDFAEVVICRNSDAQWIQRVKWFVEKQRWMPDWGKTPLEGNPSIPISVLKQFGL